MPSSATAADIEELYRERFHAFLRTVTALLRDGESARDVVQDAFALALKRRGDYAGGGPLEAWVWRIVVNRALDERRARARAFRPVAATDLAFSGNGSYESAQAVRALLLALPEQQRLAIFLRYYADLDYDSIAHVLDISPGTVGAALSRARSVMRVRLKEEVE